MTRPLSLSVGKRLEIPLLQLIASRINPRKVKPEREAHRRLAASIRAHGLLQPLVVQPSGDDQFLVIAGNRRLSALRELFKGQDPKIPCVVKQMEEEEARATALAENFAREAMHPLDEAEAFAVLAKDDGRGAEEIAAQFGVTPAYVRQRMKLAILADVVKAGYRRGVVDTGTAEAFAAVPEDKQLQVWQELGGEERGSFQADHVRSVIANAWIDAQYAQFDVAFIPPDKISRDLFGDRVLIERQTFFDAQAEALVGQHKTLEEEGWHEVVIARRSDVQDRLWRMDEPSPTYDEVVTRKLTKLDAKRTELEGKWEAIEDEDVAASDALQEKLDKLDEHADQLVKDAPILYPEPVKAVGSAFLILDADGQVHRLFRVPRARGGRSAVGATDGEGGDAPTAPPSPDDLSDRQKATLFTHQAIGVRAALFDDPMARKRVLVMVLHDKLRSEALAIRHEPNATTDHAHRMEGFTSPALDMLHKLHERIDPLHDASYVKDTDAYAALSALTEAQLDDLIGLLTVDCLAAHLERPTELVSILAMQLGVDLRAQWRPDAQWLASYQKFQLAQLIGALRGPVYSPHTEKRKKTELAATLATLFVDAGEGRLEDAKLAERVNRWLPSMLRQSEPAPDDVHAKAA